MGGRPLLHSTVKTPTVSSKVADQGPGPSRHQSQCQDAPGSPDTKHPKSEVPICTWGRLRRQVGEHKPESAALLAPSSLSQRGTTFLGTRCPGHSQERVGLGDTAPAVSHLPYISIQRGLQPLALDPPTGPRIALSAGRVQDNRCGQVLLQGHQSQANIQQRWVWFLPTAPLHKVDGEACVGWRWTTFPLLWYPYCPFQSRSHLCQHPGQRRIGNQDILAPHPKYTSIPLQA